MTSPVLTQALEALSAASDCIGIDRTALAESHFDQGLGRVDDEGQEGLDAYDEVLGKIDGAIASLRAADAGVQPSPTRWHELKTDPDLFDAVADGRKTFEIRLNDRDYKVGDGLLLRRTRDTGWAMKNTGAPLEYTGHEFRAVVTHILDGYGLQTGWVILSFAALSASPAAPKQQSQPLLTDEDWQAIADKFDLIVTGDFKEAIEDRIKEKQQCA